MIRQQILENLKTTIGDAVGTNEKVFINRGLESDIQELPIVNIISRTEEVSRYEYSPKSYKRNFIVDIECIVAANTFSLGDNRTELLMRTLESRIESAPYFNDEDFNMELTRIEYDFNNEGQCPLESATMTYNFEYSREVETASLPDLSGIFSDWTMAAP